MSSLENGLSILALIGETRPILRVTEVAEILGLPKATVSRTLKTLCETGLLERQYPGAGYGMGSRVLEMAQHYYARHTCLNKVDAALKLLVEKYGFTGHAGTVIGGERVLLIARQGWYALQHSAKVAERKFAFDSIIGQSILARQTDEVVFEVLGLKTPQKEIHGFNQERVTRTLANIRAKGIALSYSLITPGISSIGAALEDRQSGEKIGFCLSFPTNAANEETLNMLTQDIFIHAKEIGTEMHDPFWQNQTAPISLS
ncbi:IclR family transcriptional regulator [Mesorhizobium sp. A623]